MRNFAPKRRYKHTGRRKNVFVKEIKQISLKIDR